MTNHSTIEMKNLVGSEPGGVDRSSTTHGVSHLLAAGLGAVVPGTLFFALGLAAKYDTSLNGAARSAASWMRIVGGFVLLTAVVCVFAHYVRRGFRHIRLLEIVLTAGFLVPPAIGANHVVRAAAKARLSRAEAGIGLLRTGILHWQKSTKNGACPQGHEFVDGDIIRREELIDPWGSNYQVKCSKDEVSVVSLGPDRVLGTSDDIEFKN